MSDQVVSTRVYRVPLEAKRGIHVPRSLAQPPAPAIPDRQDIEVVTAGITQKSELHSEAYDFETGEKSSRSPGRTGVLSSVPAASSSTERARRQPDRRQGGTLLLIFLTTFRRSRKTRSMANFMPKVCTASQGTIHMPSPSPRECLPSRPRVRASPRSATSTQATMLCVL